jgi:pyruvate/2-oxoglutarate dehydrogenase complex dihydrolipoamide acyltransferase (E2) component
MGGKIAEITLPKWGLEMEEATVIEWFKQVGDKVEKGENLLMVETDKAEGEVEAEVSGRLVEIVAQVDDVVPVGGVLCQIELDG